MLERITRLEKSTYVTHELRFNLRIGSESRMYFDIQCATRTSRWKTRVMESSPAT